SLLRSARGRGQAALAPRATAYQPDATRAGSNPVRAGADRPAHASAAAPERRFDLEPPGGAGRVPAAQPSAARSSFGASTERRAIVDSTTIATRGAFVSGCFDLYRGGSGAPGRGRRTQAARGEQ